MEDCKLVLAVAESCGCCENEYYFKSAETLKDAFSNLKSEDNIYWVGKDDLGEEFCIDVFWGYCVRDIDGNEIDSYNLLSALAERQRQARA